MPKKIGQVINEKEISTLEEKSLSEAKNFSEVEIIKKKYLEKGGIISQFFQQVSQEKDLAKKMIPIIQAQLDEKTRIITDYDKKIADLLKNIPDGTDRKKGGLINLESMDPQTKMIMGAIIFLIIYFAFIKEKDN